MQAITHHDPLNITTHNGTVTVHNPKTGNHRTFRIRTQPDNAEFAPGERVVSLLTGPDNEGDYRGFGFVMADGRIRLWRRCQTATFEAYARILMNPDHYAIHHGLEFMSEGRCRRCNRTLTTPESVASGIGPVCAGRE